MRLFLKHCSLTLLEVKLHGVPEMDTFAFIVCIDYLTDISFHKSSPACLVPNLWHTAHIPFPPLTIWSPSTSVIFSRITMEQSLSSRTYDYAREVSISSLFKLYSVEQVFTLFCLSPCDKEGRHIYVLKRNLLHCSCRSSHCSGLLVQIYGVFCACVSVCEGVGARMWVELKFSRWF